MTFFSYLNHTLISEWLWITIILMPYCDAEWKKNVEREREGIKYSAINKKIISPPDICSPLPGRSVWETKMTTRSVACRYFRGFQHHWRDYKEFEMIKLCIDPVVKCLCLSIMSNPPSRIMGIFQKSQGVKLYTTWKAELRGWRSV